MRCRSWFSISPSGATSGVSRYQGHCVALPSWCVGDPVGQQKNCHSLSAGLEGLLPLILNQQLVHYWASCFPEPNARAQRPRADEEARTFNQSHATEVGGAFPHRTFEERRSIVPGLQHAQEGTDGGQAARDGAACVGVTALRRHRRTLTAAAHCPGWTHVIRTLSGGAARRAPWRRWKPMRARPSGRPRTLGGFLAIPECLDLNAADSKWDRLATVRGKTAQTRR